MINSHHKNPKISVVIPAFNEEKFIERCLFSILNQNFEDFELIVVDNNSIDNTAKIAKRFGAKVIFEKNQGVGFARQKGFSEAKGEIIATTDADAIVSPNWLSRIVEEFKKDKNLVAFGGLYNLYSGPIGAKIAVSHLSHLFWKFDKFFSGGWSLLGINFAVKKEAFLKVGGFKTWLKLGEDVDISQRLKTIGKVILDPNFRVQASGRRFKNGLFFGLWNYLPNALFRIFLKKEKFVKLSSVRKESSIFNFDFLLTVLLIILFFHLNPLPTLAKEVKIMDKKIIFTEKIIQENIREKEREFLLNEIELKSVIKNLRNEKSRNKKYFPNF